MNRAHRRIGTFDSPSFLARSYSQPLLERLLLRCALNSGLCRIAAIQMGLSSCANCSQFALGSLTFYVWVMLARILIIFPSFDLIKAFLMSSQDQSSPSRPVSGSHSNGVSALVQHAIGLQPMSWGDSQNEPLMENDSRNQSDGLLVGFPAFRDVFSLFSRRETFPALKNA